MSIHADQSQADRSRVYVVCTLAAVAMIIRRTELIISLFMSHDFECTVGDYLVGIHVDRCTCTTLYHVDREVLMPFTVDNLAASLTDCP